MMDTNKPNDEDNSFAHLINESKDKEPRTYDPDRYVTGQGDAEEGIPLEDQDPDKGYSANSPQGKQIASLPLADEDMDRRPEDAEQNAQDLKESFKKSKEASNEARTQEGSE